MILGDLDIGSRIVLGKFDDEPIVWKIAGGREGHITLVTEKIIRLLPFDAKEDGREFGNNNYILSNIRSWLNSIAPAGKWYAPRHENDRPPAENYVFNNPYEDQPGFLNAFSEAELKAILYTKIMVEKPNCDGGGEKTLRDKIFLLSAEEVGLVPGKRLEIFSNDESRIAVPSKKAIEKSIFNNDNLNQKSGWYWWLRNPYVSSSNSVRGVSTDGSANGYNAYHGSVGVRPACNLKISYPVSMV